MVEGKFTLDKKILDEEIAKEKEWNKVLIADHEGKIITTKNLPTPPSADEIKYACFNTKFKKVFHGMPRR